MVPYIILMTFGTLAMLASLCFFSYLHFKKIRAKRLVQEIGRTSEDRINADISSWAKVNKAHFISSVLFKYNGNIFCEIDSLLITDRALIVIEIKSIKGIIKGSAKDEKFTKVLGSQQFLIANAVKQNDKHIQHIENMLEIKVPIVSLVVYSNRAELLDIRDVPSHAVVIRHAEIFDTLDGIIKSLQPKISFEQMKYIDHHLKKHITNSREDIEKFREIFTQGEK